MVLVQFPLWIKGIGALTSLALLWRAFLSGLAACTRETRAASRVEEWRRGRVYRISRTYKQISVTFDGLRFRPCERAGLL